MIDGEHDFNLAPFGNCHNAGIDKINATIDILLKDIGDAVAVLRDEVNRLKSTIR